jgi:hypothetical protein
MTFVRLALSLTLAAAAIASPCAAQDKAPYTAKRVVEGGDNWSPLYSPDNRTLAYLVYEDAGKKVNLGILETGSKPTVIAQIAKAEKTPGQDWDIDSRPGYFFPFLLWSADNKSIYFLRQNGKKIECGNVSVPAGVVKLLGAIDKPEEYQPRQFFQDSRGGLVASFAYRMAKGKELASLEGQPLAVFRPDGKDVTRTAKPYRYVFAMPDGKSALAATPYEIWKLNEKYEPVEKAASAEDPMDVKKILFAGKETIVVSRPEIEKYDGEYKLLQEGGKLADFLASPTAFEQMAVLPDGRLLWANTKTQQAVTRSGRTVTKSSFDGIEVVEIDKGKPVATPVKFDYAGVIKLDALYPSPKGQWAVAMITPRSKDPNPLADMFSGTPFHMMPKVSKRLLLLRVSPKLAEAVGWIDFDGPGNILLQEQPALVWAPDGKSFALARAIRNNLAHNADMSSINLTNAEFVARGELWKVDLADK